MFNTDDQAWLHCHVDDLWIFNKLHLSRLLNYKCGPTGLKVPNPGYYCIRPCMNVMGMGINSRIEWIEKSTDCYHPSEFWCEVFTGQHLSIDYQNKKPILSVAGIRDHSSPLYKWKKWKKTDIIIDYPEILNSLKGSYEYINCEFIGGKLIEVHLRQNPDFVYGNTEAIPVWKGDYIKQMNGYNYIESEDYLRKGFYIR